MAGSTAPPAPPPPAQQQPAAIGATIALATAGPTGAIAGSLVAGVLSIAAIRAVVSAAVNVLGKLSSLRLSAIPELVRRSTTPVRPSAILDGGGQIPEVSARFGGQLGSGQVRRTVVEQLVADEVNREVEFRRRQNARVRRDLPGALAQPTDRRRAKRVQGLVGRERYYTALRESAIAGRARGVAESLNVQEVSPAGGRWRLGQTVHHTPGCVYLDGRALAWSAIRVTRFVPPIHLRCDCHFEPLPEGEAPPTIARSLNLIATARRLDEE